MEQINIDYLSEQLFNESVQTTKKISYENAQLRCLPIIEALDITDAEKQLISRYALLTGQFVIDSESMMKELGVVSLSSRSDKVKRILERCNLIPKNLQFQAPLIAYLHRPSRIEKWLSKGNALEDYIA